MLHILTSPALHLQLRTLHRPVRHMFVPSRPRRLSDPRRVTTRLKAAIPPIRDPIIRHRNSSTSRRPVRRGPLRLLSLLNSAPTGKVAISATTRTTAGRCRLHRLRGRLCRTSFRHRQRLLKALLCQASSTSAMRSGAPMPISHQSTAARTSTTHTCNPRSLARRLQATSPRRRRLISCLRRKRSRASGVASAELV